MDLPVLRVEDWEAISNRYEHRIGQVCRQVAIRIAERIADELPPVPAILDNACGTGCVIDEFSKIIPYARYTAVDNAPWALAATKNILRKTPECWRQVVKIRQMDCESLSLASRTFDASITNFGFDNFDDPVQAVREVYRTLEDAGVAVFTVWLRMGHDPLFWEAQKRVQPKERMEENWIYERWLDGNLFADMLMEGGFKYVNLHSVQVGLWGKNQEDLEAALIRNFEQYGMREWWTTEERERLKGITTKVLNDLKDEICIWDDDGKIGVPVDALIAICRKPEPGPDGEPRRLFRTFRRFSFVDEHYLKRPENRRWSFEL